jgi:cholesterol transport system auxiliary component
MNTERNHGPATTRPRAAATAFLRATTASLLLALLAACSLLGGGDRRPPTLFAPDPRVAADPTWPSGDWQLVIAPPGAARVIDSYRIAVRPTPGELQVYKGARWARTPGDMLQDTLLRTLEDSGRLPAVARVGAGVAADYRLVTDIRRFEADYAGGSLPTAAIEVNAKLIRAVDQSVVASKTFVHDEPVAGVDVSLVADAFGRGLGRISHDIAGWVLANGAAHRRAVHPIPRIDAGS